MMEVVSGIFTTTAADLYYAQRRPEGKPYPGYWEFPGGKLEPGESHTEALIRELREEIAEEFEVGRCLLSYSPVLPDGVQISHHVFRVRPRHNILGLFYRMRPEATAWGLFTGPALYKLPFLPGDLLALEKIYPRPE